MHIDKVIVSDIVVASVHNLDINPTLPSIEIESRPPTSCAASSRATHICVKENDIRASFHVLGIRLRSQLGITLVETCAHDTMVPWKFHP